MKEAIRRMIRRKISKKTIDEFFSVIVHGTIDFEIFVSLERCGIEI